MTVVYSRRHEHEMGFEAKSSSDNKNPSAGKYFAVSRLEPEEWAKSESQP
jgi:hypothetical protein